MVKVIWTEIAIEDLRSIHDYIAKDSRTIADRFINKLLLKVDLLENNPELGRVVPEFERNDLRELIEGNYRIIYRYHESKYVGIARIHHSARELKNL